MALCEPYPKLEELLTAVGEAKQRISDIGASEGAAGNISLGIGWPLEVHRRFPVVEQITLPQMAPALAGRLLNVETAAAYAYMDLVNHGQAKSLTQDELRTVVETFDVRTSLV